MSDKLLKNKRLISYLIDHPRIDSVTVSKKWIIATVSKKFSPSEVPDLLKKVGKVPMMKSDEDGNYIIFERYA